MWDSFNCLLCTVSLLEILDLGALNLPIKFGSLLSSWRLFKSFLLFVIISSLFIYPAHEWLLSVKLAPRSVQPKERASMFTNEGVGEGITCTVYVDSQECGDRLGRYEKHCMWAQCETALAQSSQIGTPMSQCVTQVLSQLCNHY
jgi:hypothetical protein